MTASLKKFLKTLGSGPTCLAVSSILLLASCDRESPPVPWQAPPEDTQVQLSFLDGESGGILRDSLVVLARDFVQPTVLGGRLIDTVMATQGLIIRRPVSEDRMIVRVSAQAPKYVQLDTTLSVSRGNSERVVLFMTPLDARQVEVVEMEPDSLPSEERAPSNPPPPPADTAGPETLPLDRWISFETVPAGATVTLTETGGADPTEYIFYTPDTMRVPSGIYEWRMELDGYLPEVSDRDQVNLYLQDSESVFRILAPTDVGRLREAADAAYQRGECEEAIELYSRIDRPAGTMTGSVRTAFLTQWFRIAHCSEQLLQREDAIDAYETVLREDPQQYRAVYQLGALLCELGDYREGEDHLRSISGQLASSIPPENKAGWVALSIYRLGLCQYSAYDGTNDDQRLNARASFLRFQTLAEPLIQRGQRFPDLPISLSTALDDAREKIAELSRGPLVRGPHP